MSSTDLTVPGNFAQTGTVDWVQLGNTACNSSYKVLGRLLNHGVDPITLKVGLQMAQQLPLARAGQTRMLEATSNLGGYHALNKDLLFGMGPDSMPHLLERSVEGLTLLAISAALSEVYVEEVAAEVLHELLIPLNPPREFTPYLPSWSRLVKGCAGTLAKTTFGITAEKFMSFHPSETSLFPTRRTEDDHHHNRWRSRSHTKDIAKALITLGEISRAKLESVTIIGGGDSGFLAAVAEWLFDLSIVIVIKKDNVTKEFYRNSRPGSTIQVRFEFEDRLDPSAPEGTDIEAFQYPTKTVRLRDVSDILWANDSNEAMQVCGRVEWSRCLWAAFGDAFRTLLNLKHHFGGVLGCAARIFHALATAEPEVSLPNRAHWIYYRDAGRGSGFVENLVFWFPELQTIELIARKAAACRLEDARANYESGLYSLARQCACLYCDRTQDRQPQTEYCLVAVAETILKAALILSNVSVEKGLNPKQSGLQRLYEAHVEDRPHDEDECERREKDLGQIVWVIEPAKDEEHLHSIDHRMRLMMDGALGLFTSLKEVEDSVTCALESAGICAYWKILEGLSLYDEYGYAFGRLHITPGRIEWNGMTFSRIQDWYDVEDTSDEFTEMEDQSFGLEMDFAKPSLRMEQTFNALRVGFLLTNSNQHTLNIPPMWLLNTAIGAHGWSRCQKGPDCDRNSRNSGRTPPQREVRDYHGLEVAFYHAQNDRALCAALAISELLSDRYEVLINNDCRSCALDMAIAQYETKKQLFIVSSWAIAMA